MPNILFKEKPLRTLVSLSDDSRVWYASVLCKATDTTYPHMLKMLKQFESVGLICTEQVGRIRIVKLTKQGQDLVQVLKNVEKLTQKNFSGDSKNVLEDGLNEREESDA